MTQDRDPTSPEYPKKEGQPTIEITESVTAEDLEKLKEILARWIRHDTEAKAGGGEPRIEDIQKLIENVEASLENTSNRKYFFAKVDGQIAGMVGLQTPDEKTKQTYAETAGTDNPIELVNMYVSEEVAGTGVGRMLVTMAELYAKSQGYTEVILNSGPRFRETAWGFYEKIGYERVGQLDNYYGEGIHAPVFRKEL